MKRSFIVNSVVNIQQIFEYVLCIVAAVSTSVQT